MQTALDSIYKRYTKLVDELSEERIDHVEESDVTLVKGWCSNKVKELRNDVSLKLNALRNTKGLTPKAIRSQLNRICNENQVAMAMSDGEAEIHLKQNSVDTKPSDTYVRDDYSTLLDISIEELKAKVNADMQILQSEIARRKESPHGMTNAHVVQERFEQVKALKATLFTSIKSEDLFSIAVDAEDLQKYVLAFYFDIRMNL